MTYTPILTEDEFSDDALKDEGFTSLGISRLKGVIVKFSRELRRRSIDHAESVRDPALDLLEVNQDHVQSVSKTLSGPVTAPKRPKWYAPVHILEYVSVAVAGAGGSNLDQSWGTLAFGLGLAVGAILLVTRFTYAERRT